MNRVTLMITAGIVSLTALPVHGSSCRNIRYGQQPESFVQRVSCARQAIIKMGDVKQAYALMAPIYQSAQGATGLTRSQSQDKLRAIVRLQLPDTGSQLIEQYGLNDVYTALTQAADIDPATGETARSKRALPSALESSVAMALQAPRVPQPSQVKPVSRIQPMHRTRALA